MRVFREERQPVEKTRGGIPEELIVWGGQKARQKPDSSVFYYFEIKGIHMTLKFIAVL